MKFFQIAGAVLAVVVIWLIFESGNRKFSLADIQSASRSADTNFFVRFQGSANLPIPGRRPGDVLYPVNIAAQEQAYSIVDMLLNMGANPKNKDSPEGRDLFFMLVVTSRPPESLLDRCLGYGVSVNTTNAYGEGPLHQAARAGNLELVRFLVSRGADVNLKDSKHVTPLHLARSVEVAQYLVSKGAMLNAKNVNSRTPADFAKLEDRLDVYRYLLDAER